MWYLSTGHSGYESYRRMQQSCHGVTAVVDSYSYCENYTLCTVHVGWSGWACHCPSSVDSGLALVLNIRIQGSESIVSCAACAMYSSRLADCRLFGG